VEGFIGRVALKRNDMAGLGSKKNLTSFIRRSKINGTVLTVYGTHKAYCPAGWRLVKPANYTDLLVEAPAWDTGRGRAGGDRWRISERGRGARVRGGSCSRGEG